MKTSRAGSFRSTDGEDFAPTLPQPVAAKLGYADARAHLRDRSGVPLLRLFATVWTVTHERAVRNAYRAGRQHAELS